MRRFLALFAALFVLALAPLEAQRLYLGGAVGQSRATASFQDPDFGDFEIDGDDIGYRAFAGFGFGPLAVEAGYRDFGNIEGTIAGSQGKISTQGFDAFVVGRFKITRVSIFGKVGAFVWDSDFDLDDLSISGDGTDLAWGAGVAFHPSDRWNVRLEYEGFDTDLPDDLEMISVGVAFNLF